MRQSLKRACALKFLGTSTLLQYRKTIVFYREISHPAGVSAMVRHDREGMSGKTCTGSVDPITGSAMESHVTAAHNPAFRVGLLENHAGSADPVAGSCQAPGSENVRMLTGSLEPALSEAVSKKHGA